MFEKILHKLSHKTDPAKAIPEIIDLAGLAPTVIEALRLIYDPEIPVNIYDLGLIYSIRISPLGHVHVHMTLTAPGCPVAQSFPGMVENMIRALPGVSDASVELVWDPPWSSAQMSEAARLQLGLF